MAVADIFICVPFQRTVALGMLLRTEVGQGFKESFIV